MESVRLLIYSSPSVFSRKSIDTRFDANELKQSCVLINTADYCHTTALEVRKYQPADSVIVNS